MTLRPALKTYLKEAMDLHQQGAIDQAMQMYRDVLAQDPKQADALHLLGGAELQKGNLDEAEKLMRKAIAIWDRSAGYYCDLGGVLMAKGSLAEAIRNYKAALKIKPDMQTAQEGLAKAYARHGFELAREFRWEESEDSYRRLLELRPGEAAAYNNLGEIYQHAGKRDEALAFYNKALELKPGFEIAHYNRAICYLNMERLPEGWADMAASTACWLRLIDKREDLVWLRLPLWDGSDLAGKKILIWGDQGIGDEILFAGMVPELVARGAQVTIECMDRLIRFSAARFPGRKSLSVCRSLRRGISIFTFLDCGWGAGSVRVSKVFRSMAVILKPIRKRHGPCARVMKHSARKA
ncbi:MAG: tetratricopeptide repeat protein [Bdellovibrionales bacterium]